MWTCTGLRTKTSVPPDRPQPRPLIAGSQDPGPSTLGGHGLCARDGRSLEAMFLDEEDRRLPTEGGLQQVARPPNVEGDTFAGCATSQMPALSDVARGAGSDWQPSRCGQGRWVAHGTLLRSGARAGRWADGGHRACGRHRAGVTGHPCLDARGVTANLGLSHRCRCLGSHPIAWLSSSRLERWTSHTAGPSRKGRGARHALSCSGWSQELPLVSVATLDLG